MDAATDASSPPPPESCVPAPGRLDLADVSFLFPLPVGTSAPGLIAVTDIGAKGSLLPTGIASAMQPLSNFPKIEVTDARVVGARVDPCFVATSAPGPCRKQIRLVAQPLTETGTFDASLHLFYDLDDAEFAKLVTELRALKSKAGAETDCKPLGLHPMMAKEGLAGPYATELRSLLLAHVGASNLTRVASMQLKTAGVTWLFAADDVAGQTVMSVAIPGLAADATGQSVSLSDTELNHLDFATAEGSKLPLLFRSGELQNAAVQAIEASVGEAFAIENPQRKSVGTIDCVSCHVADRGRRLAQELRGVSSVTTGEPYSRGGFVLDVADDGKRFNSQRAFGYFDATPSINHRTANESAEVARAINGMP